LTAVNEFSKSKPSAVLLSRISPGQNKTLRTPITVL
jgi:hypothetical protein